MPDEFDDLERITSASNALVKSARQLASRRRARYKEGLFLLEGERALLTAIEHNTHIETIILDAERSEDISPALASLCLESASRVVAMDHALFDSIADAEHPQAVLAVARIPSVDFPSSPTAIVALDAVRDPGNMGTIIRTARAAGADAIALLPGCVDPYNPKTIRASAGTVTAIPVRQFSSVDAIVNDHLAQADDMMIVAADANGTVEYRDVDWKKSLLLVVGNEAHGLSQETQAHTRVTVRIPMVTGVESLNVSVATGILLFEMFDRRRSL